jgi:hypothetical protein
MEEMYPWRKMEQSPALFFYAPEAHIMEAHIMYRTVSSSYLISFVMGGSGMSRVIKFLYSPERPEQGD